MGNGKEVLESLQNVDGEDFSTFQLLDLVLIFRRCRKAKYCGKECQSKAWSMGHRYWCSAREGEPGSVPPENLDHDNDDASSTTAVNGDAQNENNVPPTAGESKRCDSFQDQPLTV